MSPQARQELRELGLKSIQELETERGILASGRNEVYGCIFGRDSLITALELLQAYRTSRNEYFLQLVGKILLNLAQLQGSEVNIESGEEPGKIIHEYRPEGHERLTQGPENWYLYPDSVMRNFDSVDATPLFLVTVHEYSQALEKNSCSGEIYLTPAQELFSSAQAALAWLTNKLEQSDFLTYEFHPDRTHGGLRTQSWMDSTESLFYETSPEFPRYPIAPVEVQAYAWKALKLWGQDERATRLKEDFNKKFVLRGPNSISLAFALDGEGKKLSAARSSMGHVLWAAVDTECVLNAEYIEPLRKRILARDLFVPSAGVRTLSSRSPHFDPLSYHNGSIWPHDTAMLAEGLDKFGYADDAKRVRKALLNAYIHFKTPIELFGFSRGFKEYTHPQGGGGACRVQAWSAASLVALLNAEEEVYS